ncbi:outer membrane beta-barrel protein [Shewanella sp. JBTF-M18]|uniref:Outer membrane beta-barrel protein n=1 Tax=Shewanella insulae TaxID=2681496 RepID=A0A6L7I1X3_9GAMM|nr:outer membrane beta-barrel protein [Shewanella insulae]MXR70522.1 outer membrane beta-barrel protein [Shewanella insulae]
MTKKTLAVAAVITAALSAPTMAADWFIGGGIGSQENNYKVDITEAVDPDFSKGSFKDSDSDIIYELRGGVYLNDNNRVYGTYSYNSDDFARQQSFLMSYDYLVGLDANNKFNWFIGATAGVNHTSPDTDMLESKNNFVWGGQTGFMYKINDSLSTEIGYRYLKQDYEKGFASEAGDKASFALDDSQQVYLSVDYRF